MYWDTHMHCRFSGDSTADPKAMIESSIEKKLEGICFTDHIDWDYPGPTPFHFDPEEYMQTLQPLAEQYSSQIRVHIGVELGLQPHLKERYHAFVEAADFDQVIGSSHVVHGFDPYYPEFYEGKTQDGAYLEYFTSILENLAVFDDFDVYGHIDYVVRYGPNKNSGYSYRKFQDVIDEILKRYKELGGEILTLGSDAHAPDQIAYDYHRLSSLLANAGFTHYTVFRKRKPVFFQTGR